MAGEITEKKMDYVKEETFRVSFAEERTHKDFAREESERGHSKKKEKYVQRSNLEEAKLK